MILVDDREGSQDLALHEPVRGLLSPCPGCQGLGYLSVIGRPAGSVRHTICRGTGRQLGHLASGDICIIGNGPSGSTVSVGIELKSIADVLSSFDTGRLQGTQIPGMNRDYDVRWLLMYGVCRPSCKDGTLEYLHYEKDKQTGALTGRKWWQPYTQGRGKKILYSYLRAALMELTVLGFSYDHVADLKEASVWVGVLHSWWTKEWGEHKLMHKVDQSRKLSLAPGLANSDPRRMQRLKTAMSLPGIGYDKAAALADGFGSVREMVNAGVERVAEVEVVSEKGRRVRIGKVIAKAIDEAVS